MSVARAPLAKAEGAMRTIGEMAAELGVGQHVLRYWEGKFPQLRPLQRAGGRRYYRPADADLLRRIHHALHHQGYSLRGVQQLLAQRALPAIDAAAKAVVPEPPAVAAPPAAASPAPVGTIRVEQLIDLRDRLSAALSN